VAATRSCRRCSIQPFCMTMVFGPFFITEREASTQSKFTPTLRVEPTALKGRIIGNLALSSTRGLMKLGVRKMLELL
jgi:hypothetical protein